VADYKKLEKLGFSKAAAICYEELIKNGTAKIPDIEKRTTVSTASIYRALKQLEQKGFVEATKISTTPVYYRAVPIDRAIENLALYHRRELKTIIEEQARTAIERKLQNTLR
jgi:sugar-specific transcriptional regulator TrmB